MKAKIIKGFEHLGRWINPGDEFDDEPAVIAALISQGYAEPEGQPGASGGQGAVGGQQSTQQQPGNQQSGLSSQGKPAQQQNHQQQEAKHHKGRSEAQ